MILRTEGCLSSTRKSICGRARSNWKGFKSGSQTAYGWILGARLGDHRQGNRESVSVSLERRVSVFQAEVYTQSCVFQVDDGNEWGK